MKNRNTFLTAGLLVAILSTLLVVSNIYGHNSNSISSSLIIADSKIISETELTFGNHTVLETKTSKKEIISFYNQTLNIDGWSNLSERDNFLAFSKGNLGLTIDLENISKDRIQVSICITNV